jgi:hypothetical protein
LSYSSLLLFWPLYCLFFFEWQLLITLLATVLSVLLWVTAPYYSFGHCIVCSSSFGHCIVTQRRTDNTVAKRVIRSSNSKKNRQCSGQKSNKEQ